MRGATANPVATSYAQLPARLALNGAVHKRMVTWQNHVVPPRLRLLGRKLLWRLGLASLLLVLLLAGLRLFLHGRPLANVLERILNDGISGRVEVGSVEWTWGALAAGLTGSFMPVTIRDVQVFDGEGVLVIKTHLGTGEIEISPLVRGLFGQPRFIFRNLNVPEGGYGLIEEKRRTPYGAEHPRTSIGLTSVFDSPHRATFGAGRTAYVAPIFDLQDYTVNNVTLHFKFPLFEAHAEGVTGSGYLKYDGTDVLSEKLFYSLSPTATSGWIRSDPVYADLEEISVLQLRQAPIRWPRDSIPHDLTFKATAKTKQGAPIALEGSIVDFYTDRFGGAYDVRLVAKNAGADISRHTFDLISGENSEVEAIVTGATLAPVATIEMRALDTILPLEPKLPLRIESAAVAFNFATDTAEISETQIEGADGSLTLAGNLALEPFAAHLSARIDKPLDLSPYLPRDVRRTLGSRLSGTVSVSGDRNVQRIDRLALTLGRARFSGSAYLSPDGVIRANGLQARVGKTVVKSRGQIHAVDKVVDLALEFKSGDTARLLRSLGAPELAESANGTAHISGPLASPTITANVNANGVWLVGGARAQLIYRDGLLKFPKVTSQALDGQFSASGALSLRGRPRLVGVKASGEGLSLGQVPLVGQWLSGNASLEAKFNGPLDNLDGLATAHLTNFTAGGDAYQDTDLSFSSTPGQGYRFGFDLNGKNGSRLAFDAGLSRRGALDGSLSLDRIDLASIGPLKTLLQETFGANVSAHLALSGTANRPTAEGSIQAQRSWFRSAFLGSAELSVAREGPGVIRLKGRMLQGRVSLDGTLSTSPPFAVDLNATIRRVEFDHLAPALAALGMRGWASGEVRWRSTLMPVPGKRPIVDATLSEAVAVIANDDLRGRPAPIRLRNRRPVSASYDGETLTLLDPVVLSTPAGDLTVSGSASAKKLDLAINGAFSMRLLEPYVRSYAEDLSGSVKLSARLGGAPTSLAALKPQGTLEVQAVALQLSGQDALLKIPTGKIELADDQVSVTGLRLLVVDRFSDETSELAVSGGVKLDDFQPKLWGLFINGKLAGKLLSLFAPQAVSSATGTAELSISFLGAGASPNIDGTIDFSAQRPLTITPRGLRRRIALTGGSITFDDQGDEQLIQLANVSGNVDNEGQLVNIEGDFSLKDWQPIDFDISVEARDLPFRVPQTLSLAANANVKMVGDFTQPGGGELEISGKIDVIEGRYTRRHLDLWEYFRPQRSVDSGPGIFEEIPLLANAKLDLKVKSSAFSVKNNVADMELAGGIELLGTPKDPRLGGDISVRYGQFKLQGVRARFTETKGTIIFDRLQEFPADTPTIDITSKSDFRDITGQDYVVTLRLVGTWSKIDFSLTTNTGLNTMQTFALITTARTPEQFRSSVGDEAIGGQIGEFEGLRTTAPTDSKFAVADELLKDLSGEALSVLVADPIKNITNLDVFNLRIGAGSIGVHGEKRITRSLRLIGDAEQSSRGRTLVGGIEQRFTDRFSLDGELLQKNFDDEAEDDINNARIKLTYRLPLIP